VGKKRRATISATGETANRKRGPITMRKKGGAETRTSSSDKKKKEGDREGGGKCQSLSGTEKKEAKRR